MAAGEDYVAGWFASAASSSAATDVIVVAVAACVFFIVEGRRLGVAWSWVLVPATFAIAVAFTVPLFLALRERRQDVTSSHQPATESGRAASAAAEVRA